MSISKRNCKLTQMADNVHLTQPYSILNYPPYGTVTVTTLVSSIPMIAVHYYSTHPQLFDD